MAEDSTGLTEEEKSLVPFGESGPRKPAISPLFKLLGVTLAVVLVAIGLTEAGSVSGEQTVGQDAQASNAEGALPETTLTTTGDTVVVPESGLTDSTAPDNTTPDTSPAGVVTDVITPETTAPDAGTAAPEGTVPALVQAGAASSSQFIASDAGTTVPVYDTAWQMLVLASPNQADQYFATLAEYGFTGTWAGVVHHAPATYADPFNGGGTVATLEPSGLVVLTPEYIAHVREILDAADRHGQKVGLVAAWQNLYLPGGRADAGNSRSDTVRGTITAENSYAYGEQLVESFGDHPAVSMWVFGGDAGSNNTEANKVVWRNMANGVRDSGSTLDITYHTPTSEFDQLNYAGESWLDFIAPETGHGQTAAETQGELLAAADAYQIPVWQGEARYFNINFDWVPAAFRNPGVTQVRADAVAARNAGVTGYVYGDAGRWNWCGGFGDSTPCDRNDISASFGAGEEAVIDVFTDAVGPDATTSDDTGPAALEPAVLEPAERQPVAEAPNSGVEGPITVDLYENGTCIFLGSRLEALCNEPGLSTVQVIPNR